MMCGIAHRRRKQLELTPAEMIKYPEVGRCVHSFSNADGSGALDWEMDLRHNPAKCLKLVVAEGGPYTIFETRKPPWIVRGCVIDIVSIITKHLGYCYQFVRASDNDWGIELPNGSWSGSLGMLNRGDVAMSAAVYSITESRAKAMDFSEPLFIDELTIGYVRPVLRSDMMGFIKPYTLEVWIAVLLGTLAISVGLLALTYVLSLLPWNQPSPSRNSLQPTGSSTKYTVIVWPFSCLIDRSIAWNPQDTPVRAVACTWLLMAFIISNVYRSNLMAMLVSPKVQLPFRSLEQLEKTDITLWVPLGSRFHEALMEAPPQSTIGRVKKNTFLSANGLQGLKGYEQGLWSLITYKGPLTYTLHKDFSQRGYCRFYIMPEGIFKINALSLAFPKRSPLKSPVDKIIRNLREFGIVDHLFKKHVVNATECLKPIGSEIAATQRSLELQDFYALFSIYIGGMVLSTVSFLLELKGFFRK